MRIEADEPALEPGDCFYFRSQLNCWELLPKTSLGAMHGRRHRVSAGTTAIVVWATHVSDNTGTREKSLDTSVVLLLVENMVVWTWESNVDAWMLNDR